MNGFVVSVASEAHLEFADQVCKEIEESAKARGTGIAKRNPDYIKKKMQEGKAVIAFTDAGELAGFCYVESWGHDKFVANSGLIVVPKFRLGGLASKIKEEAFKLSRKKFPNAKLFGLTTSQAVMKINSQLGYDKVQFSQLTDDNQFWKGCSSCINYDILTSTDRKHCLCTGMLYNPEEKEKGFAKENKEKAEVLLKEDKPKEKSKELEKKPVVPVTSPKAYELDEVFC